MQIRPFFMFHGDQSIRRASSSSSIRQLVNKVDEIDEKIIFLKTLFLSFREVSGRIECKLGPFFMFHGDQSIRRSSSSSSIRQLVNKVDEIDEKNIFLKTLFLSFR